MSLFEIKGYVTIIVEAETRKDAVASLQGLQGKDIWTLRYPNDFVEEETAYWEGTFLEFQEEE